MQSVSRNILTIDVEEHFHSPAFDALFGADKWPQLESRIEFGVDKVLRILDEHDVTATFFILGWVAERFPETIRKVLARGHEIGCHGYSHRFVYKVDSRGVQGGGRAHAGASEGIGVRNCARISRPRVHHNE